MRESHAPNLPPNVRVRRKYVRKIGPRKQRKRRRNQVKRGLILNEVLLKTAFNIGKKALGSNFGKMLVKEGIDHLPTMYEKTKKRIKIKNVKKLLDSDLADYAVDHGIELVGERLNKSFINMSKDISNIDINRIFNKLNNEDINLNFIGVFPSVKINKFVSFDRMMTGKKHPFLISNTDRSDKNGTHCWSIFDIEPKNEFFLFDLLGIEGLKKIYNRGR